MEETMGDCKCKQYFCKKHRLPEEHRCTFDYKQDQREKLTQQLQLITSEKVVHI